METPPDQMETHLVPDPESGIIPAPEDELITQAEDKTEHIPFSPVESSEPFPPSQPETMSETFPPQDMDSTPPMNTMPPVETPPFEPTPSSEYTSSPVTPMDPEPRKESSGTLKIVLIAFALILVGTLVGVLAANFLPSMSPLPSAPPPPASETPSDLTPTSDLQTVDSIDYSFTVQIPSSWQIVSAGEFPYLFQYQAPDESTFEILVQDLAAGTTLLEYLALQDQIALTAFEGKPSKNVISSTEITVNGIAGIEREEEFLAAGLTGRTIYIPGKTKIYSLSFVPGSTTIPVVSSQTYEAKQTIIDSFRLTGTEGTVSYTCPTTEFVDCLPDPSGVANPQCQPDFLSWAKANCPGFQGAAL